MTMGERVTPMGMLVDCLKRMGISYVFGIPGRAIMSLYNAAYDLGFPTPVLTSHETGAAFMALTWAQVAGRPGVCCATSGPGASNMLTGVATAFTEGVPLLVLTGQVPLTSFGTRAYQESTGDGRTVDTVSLFRPVTKRSELAVSSEHLAHLIASLLPLAREGRPGPVHISVPWDVWDQELTTPNTLSLV